MAALLIPGSDLLYHLFGLATVCAACLTIWLNLFLLHTIWPGHIISHCTTAQVIRRNKAEKVMSRRPAPVCCHLPFSAGAHSPDFPQQTPTEWWTAFIVFKYSHTHTLQQMNFGNQSTTAGLRRAWTGCPFKGKHPGMLSTFTSL